jgi:hypothetical protein
MEQNQSTIHFAKRQKQVILTSNVLFLSMNRDTLVWISSSAQQVIYSLNVDATLNIKYKAELACQEYKSEIEEANRTLEMHHLTYKPVLDNI